MEVFKYGWQNSILNMPVYLHTFLTLFKFLIARHINENLPCCIQTK